MEFNSVLFLLFVIYFQIILAGLNLLNTRIFNKEDLEKFNDLDILYQLNNDVDNNEINNDLYLELAVFLDDKAYANLVPNLVQTDEEVKQLLLGYVNQIQAIYHHSSLKNHLKIIIVKIDILKERKFDMKNGNRDQLIDSFCEFQSKLNPSTDSDPFHWDTAILLTGLNLYVNEDDVRDDKPLGLGSINGVCHSLSSCVIVEFCPDDIMTKPWPTSGLGSTWIAAHELAHK